MTYHKLLDLEHGHIIQQVQGDVILGLLGEAEPLRARTYKPSTGCRLVPFLRGQPLPTKPGTPLANLCRRSY